MTEALVRRTVHPATRIDDSSPTNQQRRSLEPADSNVSRTASAGGHDVELPAYSSTSRLASIRIGFAILK